MDGRYFEKLNSGNSKPIRILVYYTDPFKIVSDPEYLIQLL